MGFRQVAEEIYEYDVAVLQTLRFPDAKNETRQWPDRVLVSVFVPDQDTASLVLAKKRVQHRQWISVSPSPTHLRSRAVGQAFVRQTFVNTSLEMAHKGSDDDIGNVKDTAVTTEIPVKLNRFGDTDIISSQHGVHHRPTFRETEVYALRVCNVKDGININGERVGGEARVSKASSYPMG